MFICFVINLFKLVKIIKLGKNFDVNGKRTMWWSQNIIKEYVNRAQCFIKEYDKFLLTRNIYVNTWYFVYLSGKLNINLFNLIFQLNGTQTLAENMADNIGLRQSWLAYKTFQSENNVPLPGLKEFSNDQLFFLAYANVSFIHALLKFYFKNSRL